METQHKKDALKQMLLDEKRLCDDVVVEEDCKDLQAKANKKKDFMNLIQTKNVSQKIP